MGQMTVDENIITQIIDPKPQLVGKASFLFAKSAFKNTLF